MTEKIAFCLLVALYLIIALFAAMFLDLLDYCLNADYIDLTANKTPAVFMRDFPDYNNYKMILQTKYFPVLNVKYCTPV